MAIQNIAPNYYSQARRLKEQRRQADQSLRESQRQFNERMAQDERMMNERRNQAIGMAFLDLGLDVAKAASGVGIKKAFEDPLKGLEGSSLYEYAGQQFGYASNKPKDSKPLTNKEVDSVVDSALNKAPAAAQEAAATMFGQARTIDFPAGTSVPAVEKPADDITEVAAGISEKGFQGRRLTAGPSPRRSRRPDVSQQSPESMEGEKAFLAAESAKRAKSISDAGFMDYDPKAPTGADDPRYLAAVRSAERAKEQAPGPLTTAAPAPAQPTSQDEAPVSPADAVSGQVVSPRRRGIAVGPRGKKVLRKMMGSDKIATGGKTLTGDLSDLYDDPLQEGFAAYDKIFSDATAAAEAKFPELRRLSKEEFEDLSNSDKRAYLAGRAARNELVQNEIKIQTNSALAKYQFARQGVPSDAQVLASLRQAEDQKARHGFYTKTGLNNLARRVAASQRFTILTSFREDVGYDTTSENYKRQFRLLTPKQKQIVAAGGDATYDRDMTDLEIQGFIQGLERYGFKKAAADAKRLANAKGLTTNKGVFLNSIMAVTPKKYVNSHGDSFNIYEDKMLDRMIGADIGSFIPNGNEDPVKKAIANGSIGPDEAKALQAQGGRGVQNRARALAMKVKEGKARFKRARTREEAEQIRDIVEADALQLHKLVQTYNRTRILTPKAEQRLTEKTQAAAADQAIRDAKTARQKYVAYQNKYAAQQFEFERARATVQDLERVPYEPNAPLQGADVKTYNNRLASDKALVNKYGTDLPNILAGDKEAMDMYSGQLGLVSKKKKEIADDIRKEANDKAADDRRKKLPAAKANLRRILIQGGSTLDEMKRIFPDIPEADRLDLRSPPNVERDTKNIPIKLTQAQQRALRKITEDARLAVAGGQPREVAARALVRRARALGLPPQAMRLMNRAMVENFA